MTHIPPGSNIQREAIDRSLISTCPVHYLQRPCAIDCLSPKHRERLFWPDGNYFVVPDPLSPPYPDIEGQSYNLKQPTSVDRY